MSAETVSNTFESEAFADVLRTVDIAGTAETVMYGGDRDFSRLRDVFGGVGQLSINGYSSQAPNQARNIQASFDEADIDTRLVIGLREGSASRAAAEADGFNVTTIEKAVGTSDMSLLLISDSGLVRDGQEIMSFAPEGATIGFSHGFLMGHYEATGQKLREDIAAVGVCPKGMGPSVGALYAQGSGINTSFAVEQGGPEARDKALAWAYALGAPYTFQTTLGMEWRSDIYGERAMLLGGVHGLVEAMYLMKRQNDMGKEQAYTEVVESLVNPISKAISHGGLLGLFGELNESGQEQFMESYNATYPALLTLTEEIYEEVASGRELAKVVSDNEHDFPMTQVDGADMWRAGERVRAQMSDADREALEIDPKVAGAYVAGMMAQVNVLRANGHHWSEVVNESIIEAVDSLNPYMRKNGVAYMVDNCSITARRGARQWAPKYQARLSQSVVPILTGDRPNTDSHDYFGDFLNHDVHKALKTLGEMRPEIDIAVP